jgi:hypothetical protein
MAAPNAAGAPSYPMASLYVGKFKYYSSFIFFYVKISKVIFTLMSPRLCYSTNLPVPGQFYQFEFVVI